VNNGTSASVGWAWMYPIDVSTLKQPTGDLTNAFAGDRATRDQLDTYLNGSILLYNDFAGTDTLQGKKIEFVNQTRYGMIACDSIMLFSGISDDYEFLASNINTGKNIGFLHKIGKGEFLHYPTQFVVENNDTKLWISDGHKNKMNLLNISKSVEKVTTVIDTTIDIESAKDFESISRAFMLDNDITLVKNGAEFLYKAPNDLPNGDFLIGGNPLAPYLPSAYHIYKGQEKLKEFKVFAKPLINPNSPNSRGLLSSIDGIKPDKSKIVMGMISIPQINILDLNTGIVRGFRQKSSIDFNKLANITTAEAKVYYWGIEADNHYIFGMYVNKSIKDAPDVLTNEIHIFDWEGEAVKRLIVEQKFDVMTLDDKNKKLYTRNAKGEIYCYDIVTFTNKTLTA